MHVQRLAANAVPAAARGRGTRYLVNRGRALQQDGSTTLEACEVYHGAKLYLLQGIVIYVKTLTGKTRPCPCPLTMVSALPVTACS